MLSRGGALNSSNIGNGACQAGRTVCTAGEIVCEGAVQPQPELCNGIDDNCDGVIDEGFAGLGTACNNGEVGVCLRSGNRVCNAAGTAVVCDAPDGVPGPELCNGLDDDCDTMIDEATPEAPLPGVGSPCSAGVTNQCQAGTLACVGGALACQITSSQEADEEEICDGIDNDCNGLVDDGVAGVGEECACEGFDVQTLSQGICSPGQTACRGSTPLACIGCKLPSTEVCDGLDNNCNGVVDEGDDGVDLCAFKGPTFACIQGNCERRCDPNLEAACPSNFACGEINNNGQIENICRSTKCQTVVCENPGWQCEPLTGECVDPCAGVTCQPNETCFGGTCSDCTTNGCPAGQFCDERECKPDLCVGVTCPENQNCREGQCVAGCIEGCDTDERCVAGQCVANKCGPDSCDNDFDICNPATGTCRSDVCALKQCGTQVCVPVTGDCIDDPCNNITCTSPCQHCRLSSDGSGQCVDNGACTELEQTVSLATTGPPAT